MRYFSLVSCLIIAATASTAFAAVAAEPAKVFMDAQVLGSVKLEKSKPAALGVGDLMLRIASEPAPNKEGLLPFVIGQSSSGAAVFSIHLTGDEASGTDDPTAEIRLIRLDPSSPAAQVVLTYFWAGAHCCTVTKIATQGANGAWQVLDGGILDGDGYQFKDLEENGGGELVSVDNSFLYAFGCYACSFAPTRIKKIVGGELRDVTTESGYRDFLQATLREMEANARQSDALRTNGFLGGWVAQKALLGELTEAWPTMLARYDRHADWTNQTCLKPVPLAECADADKRDVGFPRALADHLLANGYITAEQRRRLSVP